jgi:hypothetical protein
MFSLRAALLPVSMATFRGENRLIIASTRDLALSRCARGDDENDCD